MPRLTSVVVWPTSGKATKPWEDIAETDSFIRTSRRVSEAFRAALEAEDIQARDAAIELFLDAESAPGVIVLRLIERGVTDGAESGSVSVSTGFHTLDPFLRAFYVADVLEAAALRLGDVHGWDTTAIRRAMDRVRENDYAFEWAGTAVPSEDGSLAVRLHARLDDDGFGRVRFEFVRTGETEPFLVTGEIAMGTKRGDFTRLERSVLWEGTSVLSARLRKRAITVDLTSGELTVAPPPRVPRRNIVEADPSVPLPRIVVEDPPPISFTIGGGPLEKVPAEYSDELDRLFAYMATELNWVAWWLRASIPVIELEYWLEAKTQRTRVRVEGDVLSAVIVRPRKTITAASDLAGMARADVLDLLADVRLHTGLDEHPPLPE